MSALGTGLGSGRIRLAAKEALAIASECDAMAADSLGVGIAG